MNTNEENKSEPLKAKFRAYGLMKTPDKDDFWTTDEALKEDQIRINTDTPTKNDMSKISQIIGMFCEYT